MLTKITETEILKGIAALEKEQQDKVLHYIQLLLNKSKNNSPNLILQFAGTLDKTSLEEMSIAIQEGCENIDKNEWQ